MKLLLAAALIGLAAGSEEAPDEMMGDGMEDDGMYPHAIDPEMKAQLLKKIDSDGDSKLSLAELKAQITKIHELEIKEMHAGQEDQVTMTDQDVDEKLKDETTLTDFKETDRDGNGEIAKSEAIMKEDEEEYESDMHEYERSKNLQYEKYDLARFDKADADKSGTLSMKEFVHFRNQAWNELDHFLFDADHEAKWLIKWLDDDKDGAISQEELEVAHEKPFGPEDQDPDQEGMAESHHDNFWQTIAPSHLVEELWKDEM